MNTVAEGTKDQNPEVDQGHTRLERGIAGTATTVAVATPSTPLIRPDVIMTRARATGGLIADRMTA